MTSTCDIEGHISVIIERKMPPRRSSCGNGRNGANATGSMALHSLCERRGGLRCRRRVAPQSGDLQRDALHATSSLFLRRGFLPRLFAANASRPRDSLTNFNASRFLQPGACYLHFEHLVQRADDLSWPPRMKGERWCTTLFARRPKHRLVLLRGRLNFETMRLL